jgi:hypothetical protein
MGYLYRQPMRDEKNHEAGIGRGIGKTESRPAVRIPPAKRSEPELWPFANNRKDLQGFLNPEQDPIRRQRSSFTPTCHRGQTRIYAHQYMIRVRHSSFFGPSKIPETPMTVRRSSATRRREMHQIYETSRCQKLIPTRSVVRMNFDRLANCVQ